VMYAFAFLEQQREIWNTKVLLTIIMGALSRCHCEWRNNLVKMKIVNKQRLNLPLK